MEKDIDSILNLRSVYAELNKSVQVKNKKKLNIYMTSLLIISIFSFIFAFFVNDVFVSNSDNLLSIMNDILKVLACIVVSLVSLGYMFLIKSGSIGIEDKWSTSQFEEQLIEYMKENVSKETLDAIYNYHLSNDKSLSIPTIEQALDEILKEKEFIFDSEEIAILKKQRDQLNK